MGTNADSANKGKSSKLWPVVAVVFLWLAVSVAAFKVFLVVNPLLAVTALACLLVEKLRSKLPDGFSSRKRLLGALALALLGLAVANSARGDAIEKQEEVAADKRRIVAEGDRKIRAAKSRLEELSSRAESTPVEVYQELAGVLPRDGSLNSHPEIDLVRKTIDQVRATTAKPYAAHRYAQAKSFLKDEKLTEAQSAIQEAMQLDANLANGQDLADQIANAVALDAAEQSAASLRETSADTMKTAKKLMANKDFISASAILEQRLGYLSEHGKLHGKLVSVSALEKRVHRLHASLVPKVEKQKLREAKEKKERDELLAYCGKPPKQNSRGGVVDIAVHLMRPTIQTPSK